METNELNSKFAIGGQRVVPFIENAIYDTAMACKILRRSERVVRHLCAKGLIKAQKDRAGWLITGWQLRAFAENSCDLKR